MQEVYVEKSGIRKKDSGNGLFIKKKCPSKSEIGSFGGVLLCGDCIRKRNCKWVTKRYNSFLLGQSYMLTENDNGVFWHVVRTYDRTVDGPMWFINSSKHDAAKGYKFPNVTFESGILLQDQSIDFKVFSGSSEIEAGSELLAQYM